VSFGALAGSNNRWGFLWRDAPAVQTTAGAVRNGEEQGVGFVTGNGARNGTGRGGYAIALSLGIAAVLSAGRAAELGAQKPSTTEAWQIIQPPQSSLVFAADGSLIGEIGKQFRSSVSLNSLPRYLPEAFVAVEDKRFYTTGSIDFKGYLGALTADILHGERRGASTIPEQLAGIMHPDLIDRKDISLSRKAAELKAAIDMENHYSKDQILEAYLNMLDFGHNWFGVEAASRHYFGKDASQVTLAEAASLAALPKTPTGYDPIRKADANKTRRNVILDLMVDQGYVSRADADKAKAEPVKTVPNGGVSAPSNYFVDAVKAAADSNHVPVANGGYRIYTTLDPVLQNDAVKSLLDGIAKNIEALPDYGHMSYATAVAKGSTDYLQGVVVAMDPTSGDVKALVGGRNYALGPFNRATLAKRQPGSSIKPIVYAAALTAGIPMNTIYEDTTLEITLPNGDVYRPGEFDHNNAALGPMTMREGLVLSRNRVAVQVGMQTGMDSVAALSARLGITSRMLPVPASAIGASVVRPIELVSAYTAFANSGQVVAPRFITRITDAAGRTVLAVPPSTPRQVLDPRVAFIVRDAMRDVVQRGTGVQARQLVPDYVPMAGKTGTTNDNVDVWFMGMTPDLVAGIWLGFDKQKTITLKAAGGVLAAPIWGSMMAKYYANQRPGDWPAAPDGMVFAQLDRTTGQLATPFTPPEHVLMEYFLPGTEPAAMRGSPWNVPRWGPIIVP